MVTYSDSEVLEYDEYVDFLRRTDLGSQYPRKGFEERIPKLLQNIDICVTARNEDGLLIGICFGLTDFVYFLFLTDLGVDRAYSGQGIGRRMVEMTVAKAGGPEDITVTTISNENAIGFYDKIGLRNGYELVVRYCSDWEDFVVE